VGVLGQVMKFSSAIVCALWHCVPPPCSMQRNRAKSSQIFLDGNMKTLAPSLRGSAKQMEPNHQPRQRYCRLADLLTRRLLRPQIQFHSRGRKVQRMRPWVVFQIERLALAPLISTATRTPFHTGPPRQSDGSESLHIRCPAGRTPVILEARKRISPLSVGAAASSCRESRYRRPKPGRSSPHPQGSC